MSTHVPNKTRRSHATKPAAIVSAPPAAPSLQVLPRAETQPTVILVDRVLGQAVMCTVISEIPNGAKRLDALVAFYQSRGLRVIDAVERVDSEASS